MNHSLKVFLRILPVALVMGSWSGFCVEQPAAAPNLETAASVPHERKESKVEDTYLLRTGDKVHIRIYPEDDYIKGGEMEVSSEGNVTLSLAGKITVAGKTVLEAERSIAKILAADYLVNPEVVIEVLEYKMQSFVVLGQVKKPGSYQFPPGTAKLTLLQAISMAGGFSDIANSKNIRVVRKSSGTKEMIRANAESIMKGDDPDIELQAGDVINVAESLF